MIARTFADACMATEEQNVRIDAALLASVRSDRTVSMTCLLRRYAPATLRVCRRTARSSMRDEDAQTAWNEELRKLDQNDRPPGLVGRLESLALRHRDPEGYSSTSSPTAALLNRADPTYEWEWEEAVRVMNAEMLVLARYALVTMTPLQAQAFISHEANGLDRVQVCDLLRVSSASLSQLLLKARRNLRHVLCWSSDNDRNRCSDNEGGTH